MERYDWPGNVRELRNFLHRTAILADRDVIRAEDLPPFENTRGLIEPGARHMIDDTTASAASGDDGQSGREDEGQARADRNGIEAGRAAVRGAGRGGNEQPQVQSGGAAVRPSNVISVAVGTSIADMERALILATLEHCGGAKERTADLLGISLKTLYNRLRSYED
jgi:DNA-binding NtrC family response regulator